MQNKKILFLTQAAMTAALYVVLTMIASALGLASQPIQVRFSEALTILPYFTPAAIPGLFIGCIISNLLSGCVLIDIIFGSIATLIGALGTYWLRVFVRGKTGSAAADDCGKPAKTNSGAAAAYTKSASSTLEPVRKFQPKKILLTLPPIAANTMIVPFVLKYGYGFPTPIWMNALTVGAGEVISCGVLGLLLLYVLEKRGFEF